MGSLKSSCRTFQGRNYVWGNRGSCLGCFHSCCLGEKYLNLQ